jgi:hypothetical protein
MHRLLAGLMGMILMGPPVAAAAGDDADPGRDFEFASHLHRSSWVLWNPYGDAQAALINPETDTYLEIDVSRFAHPWCFLPVHSETGGDDWLVALDLRGAGQVALSRIRIEGGGAPEVLRMFPQTGSGRVASLLQAGPDGSILISTFREGAWWIDVMDPLTAAVQLQVGPLPLEPRAATAWTRGRWLVLDQARLWSWPDGETFLVHPSSAPPSWDEPPPMVRWGWPGWLLPLTETQWLAGSTGTLFELEGDYDGLIAASTRVPGASVDGRCRDADVKWLGPVTRVGQRLFLWERGGQRLLRLYWDDYWATWRFQALWSGTVHTEHRAYSSGVEAGPPPATVDEVLAGWEALPWVDLEGETTASFQLQHRHELYVLAADRERAIPRLAEQGSPSAAFALALLRAEEADAWLRELVMDPEEYGWESGCSYPRSSIGIAALVHLHGEPLGELIRIKPGQRRAMTDQIEAADQLEGMERWCGPGGFARHLLDAIDEE